MLFRTVKCEKTYYIGQHLEDLKNIPNLLKIKIQIKMINKGRAELFEGGQEGGKEERLRSLFTLCPLSNDHLKELLLEDY